MYFILKRKKKSNASTFRINNAFVIEFNLRGYILNSTELKLLSYADDVAFFCSDKESVEESLRVTHNFCALTGASVNNDKSNGFWLGMWGTTPSKFAGIQWNQPEIKYLGVPLDQTRNSGPYWMSVATTIKRKIDAWRVLDLSEVLQGRSLQYFSRIKTYVRPASTTLCPPTNPSIPSFVCHLHLEFLLGTDEAG